MPNESTQANEVINILEALKNNSKTDPWIKENTAIIVYHGIGNQMPIETIDSFGRGLIGEFRKIYGDDIEISHELVPKSNAEDWFDNVLRIKNKKHNDCFIDIYEYYWANYTEDKASWKDINTWLQGVVKGAKKFYTRNGELGLMYKDESIFFNSKTGKFKPNTYRIFLASAVSVFRMWSYIKKGIMALLSYIPIFGSYAAKLLEDYTDGAVNTMLNTVADVVIYNVVDPKSKFYIVRRQISDGGAKALRYLLERTSINEQKEEELYYPSVLVAGHSLGSQIAYDCINRINLLANEGNIKTYNGKGINTFDGRRLSQQLRGFITFGSPLDKIVFFLRENVPEDQYIRKQFLDHYHGFKLNDLTTSNVKDKRQNSEHFVAISCLLERWLEDVQWRNYYDNKDYVSGGLDYYYKLTNIDCGYKAKLLAFTHSYYWTDSNFFRDVINNYLAE